MDTGTGVVEDDATRLLCAAAHLDSRFASQAVEELLSEPTRAVPPSPGIDAERVLAECVAAVARRRLRDRILAGLMLLHVLLAPPAVLWWAALAVVYRAAVPARRLDGWTLTPSGRSRRRPIGRAIGVAVVILLAGSAFLFLAALTLVAGLLLSGAGTPSRSRYGGAPSPEAVLGSNPLVALVIALGPLTWLLPLLMLAVLLVDRLAVWAVLTRCLTVDAYDGTVADRFGWERRIRTMGGATAAAASRGLDPGQGPPNAIVYRGPHAFAGAGRVQDPWSIAVALEPAAEQGPVAPIAVTDLYAAIARSVAELESVSSLSPSARLAGVETLDQVIVAADAVPLPGADPAVGRLFGDGTRPPDQFLDPATVRWVMESPREWMRYYACHRVTGWRGELVVSVHVHLGVDERNLYVDCVPCVLPPVNRRYRAVDALDPNSPWPAVRDAVGSWVTLPLTVVGRLAGSFGRRGPAPRAPFGHRYGSAASLRELAAGGELSDDLQVSDAHRYLQILQRRVRRATAQHLEERGVSMVEFVRQAEALQFNFYGPGPVAGNFGGRGNTFTATAVGRPATDTKETA